MEKGLSKYLLATDFINSNHPSIAQYCNEFMGLEQKEQILGLYLKIRDGFLYDPFNLDISKSGLTFSNVLSKNRAWCVEKAGLLVTCARHLGIPARPGYAIVKNHLENDKLDFVLKSDLIVFHGYADIYLKGKWVKATPAFDKRVCRLSGVEPLDFDGENDSLFQEHNKSENRFMEYVHYYGEFDDVPMELMNLEMKKYYPHLFSSDYINQDFKFKFQQ